MVSSDDITTDAVPVEIPDLRARPDPGSIGRSGGRAPGRGAHAVGSSSRGRATVGGGRVTSARARANAAPGRSPAPTRLHVVSPRPKHGVKRAARPGISSKRVALGAAVVAVVVVSAVIGALLFGGGSSPAGPSPAAVASATRAATSWVDGSTFAGPRKAGVPADLGRSGTATRGTVEAVGTATSGGFTTELFIVAPPAGTLYGLSVVLDHGQVAYPVTVTPLPFVTAIPAGSKSSVPEGGRTVAPTATGPAQSWAEEVFGSPDHPAGRLGYGVAHAVKVLDEWRPTTGAAFVTRVLVPLSGPGPGLVVSRPAAAAQAALSTEARAVTGGRAGVAAATAAVAADQRALTKVAGVERKAAAAAAAAGRAHPRRAAREAGVAATARSEGARDQTSLTADQGRQAAATSKLAVAERAEAVGTTTLAQAVATSSSVMSVYDVAYDGRGRATAWAPADYQIGSA
jgi:hypothetical protein